MILFVSETSPSPGWLLVLKIAASTVTIFSLVFAVWQYRSKVKADRARWVTELYDRFFFKTDLKKVRDVIDCRRGDTDAKSDAQRRAVETLVDEEAAELTDYLNFFEYVAYLRDTRHLTDAEVEALFGYYLRCLRNHDKLVEYVYNRDKGGYHRLANLLRRLPHAKQLPV